jgi:hypothetical protein
MTTVSKISFLISFLVCIILAYYTDHRWEDWYITFRASKNFALGNGLVFNIGEKIMTYTSPLGTVLPALFYYIFKNDEITLWVYRFFCSIVLSTVPVFIHKILKYNKIGYTLIFFTIFIFIFNFLIIDNTINGMESAFMVFFISYLLYILIIKPTNKILHLTICFSGLMYTRPDGFIYGGVIIISFILFYFKKNNLNRHNFNIIIKSFIFSILIFLPWLMITYYYYNTPIPHTIVAKSRDLNFYEYFTNFKIFIINFRGAGYLLLPPYSTFGGWSFLSIFANIITFFLSFYWLYLFGNKIARSLSFSVFILLIYLNLVSGQGPMPWYLPSVILPLILMFPFIYNDFLKIISKFNVPFYKYILIIAYSLIALYFFVVFILGSIEIKNQQIIIENGVRKEIGFFLKRNKKINETVFLECLGYIGFYSEMKTFDYPGMSSKEVVYARKKLQSNDYRKIIKFLNPTWLVLRPFEITNINNSDSLFLKTNYSFIKLFDNSKLVKNSKAEFGRPYLYYDSKFSIYKKVIKNEF